MTMEDGLKLALFALSKVLDKSFNVERVDAAIIPISTRRIETLGRERLEKLLRDSKKK